MKNPFKAILDARNQNIAKRSGQSSNAGTGTNSASGPAMNANPTTGQTPGAGATPINTKPGSAGLATQISKKPLYIAMAVVGVAAYGGYVYMQHHNPFDHQAKKANTTIAPASTGTFAIPAQKPKPDHAPVAPDKSTTTGTSGASTGAAGTTQTAPTASAPKMNPYAAQNAAFTASLHGGNGASGMGLSWGQQPTASAAPSQAAAAAIAPYAAAQKELLAASQNGAPQQKTKKKVHDTSADLVTREISPYEVLQGSVIPAVLEEGIKSYLPGQITAVVSRNVYSSVNGATLLIPAGAKLIGTYSTQTTLGTNRLLAAWTRIEFPNGTYINLPGFEASGGRGYAGFAGEVNNHTWLIFKNALLMSIVDAGMALASPTSTSSNTTGVTGNQALQDSEQSLAQTFGQAESQLLQKYIDIAPTITIPAGYPFNVIATQGLVFPGPYNPAMQTGPGVTTPAVAPKPDPYNPYG